MLSLTNKAGVTIKGALLERRDDGVTVQVGPKRFEIRYDQLTDETVDMLKAVKIEERTSEQIRIDVDIKKSGEIKKSGRVRTDDFGNVDDTTGSYRIDTISGSVTITNRNSQDATAPGTLKVVILKRQERDVVQMHTEVYPLDALDTLESMTFEIKPSVSTHSAKGMAGNFNKAQGRYVGYIAAFYAKGEIVAIKSLPGSYERNMVEATKLLAGIGGGTDDAEPDGPGKKRELDGPGKKRESDGPGGK